MKKLYLLSLLMLAMVVQVYAQKSISGKITDATNGDPLPGVNVVITGTAKGTITDFDGIYTIEVPADATQLTFSYVGYTPQIVDINGTTMDIALSQGVELEDVVITALGISKKEKSLGYSVQDLEGDGFTQAREANIVNALNGKVAGVQINNSSGAVGASTRITLRGSSSLTGDNQPLFVVDGVPIDNTNYGNAGSSGGFDQPNGIADINPDDIKTMSVLKGPNAAALYGVRASNGVIVITTKKGEFGKKGIGISFNSTTSFETPLLLPTFQNSYGQGGNADYFRFVDGTTSDGGVDESWGPPLDVGLEFVQFDSYENDGAPTPWVSKPNNIRDFYDTGMTTNNNLAITGGAENASYRLSLGLMNQKGIIPNTDFQKINIGGASSLKVADKLTASLTVNYINSGSDNLPTGGYNNENPVQQMIWSGRQVDFNKLKDYENLPLADPSTPAEGTPLNWNTQFQNNPYWVLNTNLNQLNKNRILGNVGLNYQINDMFNLNITTGTDTWSSVTNEIKAKGSNENQEGFYRQITRNFSEVNSQAILGFNKRLTDDLELSLNAGAARMDRKYNRLWGEAQQLELPNVYTLLNVKSGSPAILESLIEESRINSLLFFGQLGFKDAIYLDFTGRNDWASVLPPENNSFFYPSVTLSAVVTDLFQVNSPILSFLKVRGGWARVGGLGALVPYKLQQVYEFRPETWGSVSLPFNPDELNNPNLFAETTDGVEFGLDTRLFRNKLRLDVTYYSQKSYDLIVPVGVSAASGYLTAWQNIGEMQNNGIELQLGTTLIKTRDFNLDISVNFAKNNNKVLSLEGLDALTLGGQWNVEVQAREDLPYGVIFGPSYQRDDSGNIIHEKGVPVVGESKVLGDIQPDWTGGVSLDGNFKGVILNCIIDARKGSEIFSMTNTWGRFAGVLNETLVGREVGIVSEGVKNVGTEEEPVYVANDVVVSAETYNKAAYVNSVAEGSVFDASFVKLRQVMVGFDIPQHIVSRTFFQKASLAFVGRNLGFIYKRAPHIDPESAFSSDNGEQGQEFGQLPSVRSLGVNLSLKF